MANPEHIEIIKQGVEAWNKWRKENPEITPDLKEADLREANLQGANFERALLNEANLHHAILKDAVLSFAVLDSADLSCATLRNAELKHAELSKAIGLEAGQLGGTNISNAELPQDLENFDQALSHVTESSKITRSLFVTLILACLYSVLTIAMTQDVKLLTNSASSELPVIGTSIPIVGLYVAGPIFLTGLYCYFHIYLQRLWELLADLPAVFPDGRRLCDKVHPWLLNGFAYNYFPRLRDVPRRLSILQTFLCAFLAWGSVPLMVFCFWFRYLDRHVWRETGLHIILLLFLIFWAFYFYRLAASTLRGQTKYLLFENSWWKKLRIYRYCIALITIAAIFSLVSLYAIKGLAPWGLFVLNLENAEISEIPSNWTGDDPNQLNKLMRRVQLSGTNMRNAQASAAVLSKANLSHTDLSNADLSYANLHDAHLIDANLDGADLRYAHLIGANLIGANLNGAFLYGADLRNANLRLVDLSGAILVRADLSDADLRDADLSSADLRVANLCNTDLTNTDLSYTYLLGANLQETRLIGADLRRANLKGIRNWEQIRDLTLANIFEVKNEPNDPNKFSDWARERGAVSEESTEKWKELFRKVAEESVESLESLFQENESLFQEEERIRFKEDIRQIKARIRQATEN